MSKKIFLSDLRLLSVLLGQAQKVEIIVFDPDHRLEQDIETAFQKTESLGAFEQSIQQGKTFFANLSNQKINSSTSPGVHFNTNVKDASNTYYFFNNPDGSMRWLSPKKAKHPVFLKLYNSQGFKGKLFKFGFQTAFRLGLQKILFSGALSLENADFDELSKGVGTEFGIFTGTVGENRKAIIAKAGKTPSFIKFPVTKEAAVLVENEIHSLEELGKQSFQSFEIPWVKRLKNHAADLGDVKPDNALEANAIESAHLRTLEEMSKASLVSKPLHDTDFWKDILSDWNKVQSLAEPQNGISISVLNRLKKAIEKKINKLANNPQLDLGRAHGDFTPWNMYRSEEKLHIYDWELSIKEAPLGFDFHHFIFQTGILVHRHSFQEILGEIKEKRVEKNEGAATLALDLYLLHITTYYLPKYLIQPRLHLQVHWLLDTWLEGLER